MGRIEVALVDRLEAAVNADPEFLIAARFWNAVLHFDMGDAGSFLLRVRDGRMDRIEQLDGVARRHRSATIAVVAPAEDWGELLGPVPPPFYQDLWGATNHHGFEVSGDLEGLRQYYPALARLLDVLRVIANES